MNSNKKRRLINDAIEMGNIHEYNSGAWEKLLMI